VSCSLRSTWGSGRASGLAQLIANTASSTPTVRIFIPAPSCVRGEPTVPALAALHTLAACTLRSGALRPRLSHAVALFDRLPLTLVLSLSLCPRFLIRQPHSD